MPELRGMPGRCLIAGIMANGGRDSWNLWLDVHTGEGRLKRPPWWETLHGPATRARRQSP